MVARLLKKKTEVETIRLEIHDALPPPGAQSAPPHIPFSHPVKRVLAYGAEEAEKMGHQHIGTEHHLLGLLREPSLAARILEEHGVNLKSGRHNILENRGGEAPTSILPDRDYLHGLVNSLPSGALPQALVLLQRLQSWPTASNVETSAGTGVLVRNALAQLQEGRVYSTRMEDGALVIETRHVHHSHEISKTERLKLSDDRRTLHYAAEIRGPKQSSQVNIDFDVS